MSTSHRTVIGTSMSAAAILTSALSNAQPTPKDFVSQLDFECRQATATPPPVDHLNIRQLNPVLQGKLDNGEVQLGPLKEVCVPVAKNGNIPSQAALSYIRWLDLACYEAHGPDEFEPVNLTHLNPVLSQLPAEDVTIARISQVCVPVAKNLQQPPDQALQLARYFDLGCYELEEPSSPAMTDLTLSHLNPVIRNMGLPDRDVHMRRARELCVPIAKEQQQLPAEIEEFVIWSDFLKYNIRPEQPIPMLPLMLTHLNPLFQGAAPFNVSLSPSIPWLPQTHPRLMVPVAKNGSIPPSHE